MPMVFFCLSGCDPKKPSSGNTEDTGLTQQQLWELLQTGKSRSWANDEYTALFEIKEGKYLYNQYSHDDGNIRQRFAVTSDFTYLGGGTYTFTAVYPAYGMFSAATVNVTLKLDQKTVDTGGITLNCVKKYGGEAAYSVLLPNGDGWSESELAAYMEFLRFYISWQSGSNYFNVDKLDDGYMIFFYNKTTNTTREARVVSLTGITEDGQAVFKLEGDDGESSMYLTITAGTEPKAVLAFTASLKDFAGTYVLGKGGAGVTNDDEKLNSIMSYLASFELWENDKHFFSVVFNEEKGTWQINLAVKQSDGFNNIRVMACSGWTEDGYTIFSLHADEYTYTMFDITETLPAYDCLLYLKLTEGANPEAEMVFYHALEYYNGIYKPGKHETAPTPADDSSNALTELMEYLMSKNFWENDQHFFTVGKDYATGNYTFNIGIKNSDGYVNTRVLSYKGLSSDGYAMFDIRKDEYSYEFHGNPVTEPGWDAVLYVKRYTLSTIPAVDLRFEGKLTESDGRYYAYPENTLSADQLWQLLGAHKWKDEHDTTLEFTHGASYQIVRNGSAYNVQSVTPHGLGGYMITFGGIGENIIWIKLIGNYTNLDGIVTDVDTIKVETLWISTGPVSINGVFTGH